VNALEVQEKKMKVRLPSGGNVKIGVKYDDEEVTAKEGGIYQVRTVSVKLTQMRSTGKTDEERCKGMPTLQATVRCFSEDQFVRRDGRKFALLKIFKKDTKGMKKRFATNVQGARSLSRPDRTAIFKKVCPEFFRNDSDRVALRERNLFERLYLKYGKEKEAKVLKEVQAVA
jgi:hypothetical protein